LLNWVRSVIQTLRFGGTGQVSARTLLGAAAFGEVTQREADATLDLALSHGVNHVDTAASYGDSERRLGSSPGTENPFFWQPKRTSALPKRLDGRSIVRSSICGSIMFTEPWL